MSEKIFEATYRGFTVIIGNATNRETALIAGKVDNAKAKDVLETWHFIALRDPTGGGAAVHALGWRAGLLNTWITSSLVVVDLHEGGIITRSGNHYKLGHRSDGELENELYELLADSLIKWGFENLRG